MDRIKFALFCIGTLVFNTLFWKEDLGLNTIIFLMFVMLANFNSLIDALKKWQGIVVVAGTYVSCFMLVYHHSIISYIAFIVSFIILIGYLHFSTIRTSYGLLLTAVVNLFKFPEFMFKEEKEPSKNQAKYWRITKLILIPLLIFFVFGILFYAANLYFRNAIDSIFNTIGEAFRYVFGQISIARILFLLFSAFIASWVVYQGIHSYFAQQDTLGKIAIARIRNRLPLNPVAISGGKKPIYGALKTLGLKNEYTSSLIMIVAICILLFIINCIDVFTVWFGIGTDPSVNYSDAVHEGVNLLITSILLSIFILLYIFRKNQNFYAKKQRLVIWSKIWIAQNVILIVSVIIRNYYYISHHGLTHKRIGVFIFLMVVIIGLISLFMKISKTKSFYFMAYFNSWSLYAVLIILSTVNWDLSIVKYNIHHRKTIEIDPYYLTSMSDESAMYVWNHQEELEEALLNSYYGRIKIRTILEQRIAKMQVNESYMNYSWLSWNARRQSLQDQLVYLPKFELRRPRKNYSNF